jgi:opacity protein-like surface antigen
MKKYIFLFLCCLLSGAAFAQVPIFSIGPKIGANYSTLRNIRDDVRLSSGYFTGFAGGLFARVNIRRLYIQPEVYFSQKGSNFTFQQQSTTASHEGKVRLTSIDVPLLVGIRLIDLEVFNLRAMAGPVFTNIMDESKNDLEELDPNNYKFNKSNAGYQAGLGLDVGNVTVDLRYEGGLNKINSNFNQRSSLFHLSVGLKLL